MRDTRSRGASEDEAGDSAHSWAGQWLGGLCEGGSLVCGALFGWLRTTARPAEELAFADAVVRAIGTLDRKQRAEVEAAADLGQTASTNVIHLTHFRPGTPRARELPRIRWEWAMAYSVMAIALVLGSAIALRLSANGTEYACGLGERRIIPLEDGSILTLNTQSRLRVRLSARARHVELLAGDAFFQVAHDPARPFRLHAGHTTVEAAGTQFAVHLEQDATDVSVVEGRVNVVQDRTAMALDLDGLGWAEPVVLDVDSAAVVRVAVAAGQELHIRRARAGGAAADPVPLNVTPDSLRRHLAWTGGEIAFAGETLQQAVEEFNRYNRRRMEIRDPALVGLRLGGSFQTLDPASFLAALEKVFGIEAEAEPVSSGNAGPAGIVRLVRPGAARQ